MTNPDDDFLSDEQIRFLQLQIAYDDLARRAKRLEAERDGARAAMKWTGEVYPALLSHGGAGIEITWTEFNAMREAAGFKPIIRASGKEGRAGFNARLRAELAKAESELAALRKQEPVTWQYRYLYAPDGLLGGDWGGWGAKRYDYPENTGLLDEQKRPLYASPVPALEQERKP